MDDKLAQRLKDAGFKGRWKPKLDELMEACGKEFYSLTQLTIEDGYKKDCWVATGQGNSPQIIDKTSRIAVAELFIKLNERSIDKK